MPNLFESPNANYLKEASEEKRFEEFKKLQSQRFTPKKPAKPKYAKLSLKPEEALTLLRFLDNIKTTREDWHMLDIIHSKLYKAYQKV